MTTLGSNLCGKRNRSDQAESCDNSRDCQVFRVAGEADECEIFEIFGREAAADPFCLRNDVSPHPIPDEILKNIETLAAGYDKENEQYCRLQSRVCHDPSVGSSAECCRLVQETLAQENERAVYDPDEIQF
jgi:hypothetical protein